MRVLIRELRRVAARSLTQRDSRTETSVNAVAQRIRQHAGASDAGVPFLRLIDGHGTESAWSYAELVASADRWVQAFLAAGLVPGQRVVVILEHGEPLYSAYLGALLGGFCPAYFAHPSEKVGRGAYIATFRALLAQIDADFVVTSASTVGLLGAALASCRGLLDDGRAFGSPAATRAPTPKADGPLFLQFSSGTTGIKKGVAISPDALLWQVDTYAAAIACGPDDVVVSWLPLYHDMGLIACFFLPLLRRVPVVAMSPFDWVRRPEMMLDAIERYRGTLAWLPNFAYNFLATRVPDRGRTWDLSSIRGLVNCSEPVLAHSHAAFLAKFSSSGVRRETLMSCYAMAENTFAVSSSGPGAGVVTEWISPASLVQGSAVVRCPDGTVDAREVVGSGRVLPGTDLQILDAKGKPMAEGVLGEIAVCSPAVFTGYIHNEGATRAAFTAGVFRTGDLGYLRDGELFVMGRIKDTVICGGRNVYPQDVESVVNAVPGVIPGRSVAFGVDLVDLGTQGLVVIAESEQLSAPETRVIANAVREAVVSGADLAPHDVLIVERGWLRKSTSGKISRAINRERYLEGGASKVDVRPSTTPLASDTLTKVLDAVVQTVGAEVGAGAFDADTDLLSTGLIDSFSHVSLLLELEERFGSERVVPMRSDPGSYRTVRSIAGGLDRRASAGVDAAQLAPRKGTLNLDRKYELAPQMRDVEAQPYEWMAYVMRRGSARYRSRALNTDEHGFRRTHRGGAALDYTTFLRSDAPQGIVLGNSFAYGAGTSADECVFASLLNDSAGSAATVWYNLALRASTLTQERLAFELYGPDAPSLVVWASGVNNLIALVIGEGYGGNPAPFVGERLYASTMMPDRPMRSPGSLDERYPQMIRQAERDLSALALQVRARGGQLLFCLQPSLTWIDKIQTDEERCLVEVFDQPGSAIQRAHRPETLGPLYRRYRADLMAACERWDVPFLDLNEIAALREPQWLFVDRTHMNDEGHATVARAIASWVEHQSSQAGSLQRVR